MADFGLFVGFGFPTRGREEAAVKVFQELLGTLGAQQQQGNVESFEPAFLQPHGGDLSGFVFVRGDQAKLSAMVASPEFQKLMVRGQTIVENFGVVNLLLGGEIMRQMSTFLPDTADLR
ncbi:MAG TPA: hypothetical protein VH951_08870 [Dehalococcoidia bacterium]